MVSYWKTKESVAAKVTTNSDGATVMKMDGEKHPFPGFPRGYLLFGPLSKLKHEIKNQIFNEGWRLLEEGQFIDVVKVLDGIYELSRQSKYDMVPPESMVDSVKELWRAFTVIEKSLTGVSRLRVKSLKETICYILQEDDAYRFRVQWIAPMLEWGDPVKNFDRALGELEHGEIIGDMKERVRLLRRVLMEVLKHKTIGDLFRRFYKEVKWKKVKLKEGDKYHFRGKYFKVDFDKFAY